MKKVANILIAVTFISTQLFAQQTPGNVQKEAITLLLTRSPRKPPMAIPTICIKGNAAPTKLACCNE